MSTSTIPPSTDRNLYPDDDGNPMAENSLQFKWIVLVKEGLETVFRDDPNVFVAGDLLWYAQEGDPKIRTAPDAMVVFGRPKGYRGSYMQWEEGGIPPHVVFEILSPGNRGSEMARKFRFYDNRGVEEYYVYDPEDGSLSGWRREGSGRLEEIADMQGYVSPRLGIRFEPGNGPDNLKIYGPDGTLFNTYQEIRAEADAANQRADAERQRADAERQRADTELQRAERLAARLRELGESLD
ncbi:MAG: Uma2 family endonuclease [Paludisphaera borealis]|uniref:Uma2 family endonuclease n=1 Tax=Paludisphaera borealis TaxID=1387353 RepID=UPI00284147DD|nr:Uma2 family endonuclease [Paludisphaera borealis]MDR3618368.1 Uma2 family endonuclease [Paludisphaera borealis]